MKTNNKPERPLKVYGWIGHRSGQTREIVAAPSKAAVARIAGFNSPRQMFCLCETSNDAELAQARSNPGKVFWHPLNELESRREWRS